MCIKQAGALIPEGVVCPCGQGIPPAPTLLVFKYPSLRGSLPKEIPPSCSFLPHDETKAQNKLKCVKTQLYKQQEAGLCAVFQV